jgi:DNA-binding NarL/FixJ family response regulator
MSGRVRVVLIEDHGIVREGLKRILRDEPDIEVIGDAADGHEGIRLFARFSLDSAQGGPVDVVVTDLSLPDIAGLEVVRRVKELRSSVRVLILTMHADDEYIRGMLEIGADGYLLKTAASHELAEAIRTVARGEMVLSPAVTRRLMSQFRTRRERDDQAVLLTDRERQVLNFLAGGATSKELAQRLGLSTKTVENHRSRILEKLGVANTAAAINLAAQRGLLLPLEEKARS